MENINLYNWIKKKGHICNTHDMQYRDVPIKVYVQQNKGEDNTYYYKFCEFILKHIKVITEINDHECIVNWSTFIEDNKEMFRRISAETWGKVPKADKFNYMWLEELEALMSNNGTEGMYHYYMDIFMEDMKEEE
jgi:hypothetical protein